MLLCRIRTAYPSDVSSRQKIHGTSESNEPHSPFPDPAGGVVDALVALPPAAVLEEIFDGRHAEHEEHRHHRDLLPERVDLGHPVVD